MEKLNKPFFSIVTPLFNQEKRIVRCIESVIKQTYGSFEHIIINDGSTDNSYQVALSYSLKDSRVKVFTQDNLGSSNAYNRGLALSTGDYIVILDNDDWLEQNALELLANYIRNFNDPDIVQMNYILHNDKNIESILRYSYCDKPFFLKNKDEINKSFKTLNRVYTKTNARKAIKRNLYNSVRYEGVAHGADHIVMAKILFSSETLLFIPDFLVHVEEIEQSQSRKEISIKEAIDILIRLNNTVSFLLNILVIVFYV